MKMFTSFIAFTILVAAFAAPTTDFIGPVGSDVARVARDSQFPVGSNVSITTNTNHGGDSNIGSYNEVGNTRNTSPLAGKLRVARASGFGIGSNVSIVTNTNLGGDSNIGSYNQVGNTRNTSGLAGKV